MIKFLTRRWAFVVPPVLALMVLAMLPNSRAANLDEVLKAEKERIATINKVKPSVVAIFGAGGQGGGSGVLIDPEGYALTNFHVTRGAGNVMKCGLPDGVLYDAVIVGQDKVGDVALIKLLPKKEGTPFPYAALADSDTVKVGDWSLAMGNPFLLATDFNPSISFGLISGVNRYQYPEGGILEYTDCIQFDTTINPGNSGGPLFNMKGELIGINGRGSFAQEKRFRINCGVGYAISINQIKNFMGHLYGGLDADHATLGARISTADEEADLSEMVFRDILEESDVSRRQIQNGDVLVKFAGRLITSSNSYKNVLGIYPKDWRLPLEYRRGSERQETLVRLMSYTAAEINAKKDPNPVPPPKIQPPPQNPNSPAMKFYKAKKGFTNYYFNEQHQNRLMEAVRKMGDFSTLGGEWKIEGNYELPGPLRGTFTITIGEKDGKPFVTSKSNSDYALAPLASGLKDTDLITPPNSGGLLMAMYHYKLFLSKGPKAFERDFSYGGYEPVYIHGEDGARPKNYKDIRVDTEVLRSEHADYPAKWYFTKKTADKEPTLIAFEVTSIRDQDPCEVYLADYKAVNGRMLPHRLEVRTGEKRYCLFTVKTWDLK
jgi:S1-C subfamily serine protease